MGRLFVRASSQSLEKSTPAVSGVDCTLACWFKTTNTSSQKTLIAIADESSNLNYFLLRSKSDVQAIYRDSAGVTTALGGTFTSGVWTHAAAVFNGGATAYRDAVGVNSATTRTPVSLDNTTIGKLHIGTGEVQFFDGFMGEVGIWDIDLSSYWITRLGPAFRWSPLLVEPDHLIEYQSFRFPYFNYEPPRQLRMAPRRSRQVFANTGTTFDQGPPGIVYPRERIVVPTEQAVAGGTILPQVMQHGLYAGSAA